MTVYLDSVRALLSSNSEDDYKDALIGQMRVWSKPFSEYFTDSIHPVIHNLGAWLLRPLGRQEITGNQSESFNCVLKRLQDWKEAPVDTMVLSLYRLAMYNRAEIQRGKHGVGEYRLRSGTYI